MKFWHYTFTAAALTFAAPAFAADQFFLSYSYWDYKVSGRYEQDGTNYDFDNDFKPSNSSRALYRLRWDTPAGWWPDLAASYGRIDVSGQKAVTTNTGIGPIPIQVNSTADVHANVRDGDVTLRWPWQLGWARLSAGVTAKQLRGNVLISDNVGGSTRQSVNTLFPMAHAFLEIPIGSRLRIGVGGDWAALNGDAADNIAAIVRFKVIGPLDLTGGWQRKHYKVDSDDYRLNTRLQGWQFGGELAF
jgi:hypothetical protein